MAIERAFLAVVCSLGMNATIRAEILDVLDRRYRRIATGSHYGAEYVSFVKWLLHEPSLNPYLRTIRDRQPDESEPERIAAEVLPALLAAKDDLLARIPQHCAYSLAEDNDNPRSLARWDEILERAKPDKEPFVKMLAETLMGPIHEYRQSLRSNPDGLVPDLLPTIKVVSSALDRLKFAENEVEFAASASAATDLAMVLRFCRMLNDQPEGFKSWLDFVPDEHAYIRTAMDRYDRANKKHLEDGAKVALTRLVDAVHVAVTSAAADMVLVDRFAHRSIMFDRERLSSITKETDLTLELARYMHDQGATVWTEARFGNSRLDASVGGFVIEAKILPPSCTTNDTRVRALQGYHQLHGYMTKLAGQGYDAASGAVVIFRFGGSVPDLPTEAVRGRFMMHGRVIDLGDSSVSGSRQPQAVRITEEQIIANLEEKESPSTE